MSEENKGIRLSCSTFDAAKILYEYLAEQITDDYSFTVGGASCRVITLEKFYLRLKERMVVFVTLHDMPDGSFFHLSTSLYGYYSENIMELIYNGSLKKSIWHDFGALYDFLNPVMTELQKYRIDEEKSE